MNLLVDAIGLAIGILCLVFGIWIFKNKELLIVAQLTAGWGRWRASDRSRRMTAEFAVKFFGAFSAIEGAFAVYTFLSGGIPSAAVEDLLLVAVIAALIF